MVIISGKIPRWALFSVKCTAVATQKTPIYMQFYPVDAWINETVCKPRIVSLVDVHRG